MNYIDKTEIENIFQEGGAISTVLSNFEFRQEQYEMVQAVCDAFNDEKIALIEAGTGTGKTFAYLVPAIYYAVNNNARVVIATKTINLQEQIIHKDIPLLKEILKIDFKASLLKGRGNYLCKRKLFSLEKAPDLFRDSKEDEELDAIFEWADTAKEGSMSELYFNPLKKTWNKVCAESDNCLRSKCKYFRKCFFLRQRKR